MRSPPVFLCLAVLAFLGCESGPDPDPGSTTTMPIAADDPMEEPPEDAGAAAAPTRAPDDAIASARGQYLVTCRTSPDPIPMNEIFGLEVQVFDANGQPLSGHDVHLLVDADMPEHRHGMNTRPEVTLKDGGFVVDGMLFHMPGYWEIYLDIVRGGSVERATVSADL